MQLIHKIIFRLRVETKMVSNARKLWWAAQGASFGPGTVISRLNITWPHQMTVGKLCLFEDDIFFKYSSYWKPGRSIIIHDRVLVVARMRLIGRTRFDECKHPGRASLVGSRAANYRALFWLPDAFEPLPAFL